MFAVAGRHKEQVSILLRLKCFLTERSGGKAGNHSGREIHEI
jgi:hypothetical protein